LIEVVGLQMDFEKPCGASITLSGKQGDNAKRYQEKEDKKPKVRGPNATLIALMN